MTDIKITSVSVWFNDMHILLSVSRRILEGFDLFSQRRSNVIPKVANDFTGVKWLTGNCGISMEGCLL